MSATIPDKMRAVPGIAFSRAPGGFGTSAQLSFSLTCYKDSEGKISIPGDQKKNRFVYRSRPSGFDVAASALGTKPQGNRSPS
jgi:hypothetical protein